MAHPSGAPSVVTANKPMPDKAKRPEIGETKSFPAADGSPAFEVTFKSKNIVEIKRVGDPDIFRKIVPKYGNVRQVDGQMHTAADLALWFLFNLTDQN